MAPQGTSAIFARRSKLPNFTERLVLDLNECALDLNRGVLDLNSSPALSPESPFCFQTRSIAQKAPDPVHTAQFSTTKAAQTFDLSSSPEATVKTNIWASEFGCKERTQEFGNGNSCVSTGEVSYTAQIRHENEAHGVEFDHKEGIQGSAASASTAEACSGEGRKCYEHDVNKYNSSTRASDSGRFSNHGTSCGLEGLRNSKGPVLTGEGSSGGAKTCPESVIVQSNTNIWLSDLGRCSNGGTSCDVELGNKEGKQGPGPGKGSVSTGEGCSGEGQECHEHNVNLLNSSILALDSSKCNNHGTSCGLQLEARQELGRGKGPALTAEGNSGGAKKSYESVFIQSKTSILLSELVGHSNHGTSCGVEVGDKEENQGSGHGRDSVSTGGCNGEGQKSHKREVNRFYSSIWVSDSGRCSNYGTSCGLEFEGRQGLGNGNGPVLAGEGRYGGAKKWHESLVMQSNTWVSDLGGSSNHGTLCGVEFGDKEGNQGSGKGRGSVTTGGCSGEGKKFHEHEVNQFNSSIWPSDSGRHSNHDTCGLEFEGRQEVGNSRGHVLTGEGSSVGATKCHENVVKQSRTGIWMSDSGGGSNCSTSYGLEFGDIELSQGLQNGHQEGSQGFETCRGSVSRGEGSSGGARKCNENEVIQSKTSIWASTSGGYSNHGLSCGLEAVHKEGDQEVEKSKVPVSTGEGNSEGVLSCHENGSHEAQPLCNEVGQSPNWLPAGWTTEVKTRKTGNTAGTKDKYYKDPISGSRFRSRKEVFHFLETGQKVRCKPKLKHSCTGVLALLKNSSLSSHLGKKKTKASRGINVPFEYSMPLISLSDLGTSASKQFLPNQMPEVPAWLSKILPVGAFPDYVDCTKPIFSYTGQTRDNMLLNQSQPRNIDLNVEADTEGPASGHEEIMGLMIQKHGKDMNTQPLNKAQLNSLDTGKELSNNRQPFHEEFLEQSIISRQQNSPTSEQRHDHKNPLSYGDVANERLPFINVIVPESSQDRKNACESTYNHGVPSLSNVAVLDNSLEPMRGAENTHESVDNDNLTASLQQQGILELTQAPEDNLVSSACTLFNQGRQLRRKPVGMRRLQKLKHKEGRQLLALLGKKLCQRRLEYLVEEIHRQSKD